MATWLVTRSVAPSVARPAPAHSWRARRSRAQLGGASRGELDDTLGGAVATCVGVGRWGRASGFASGLAGRTSDAATTGACAWRSRDGGGVHLEAMGLGSWLGARAASRRRADNAWRARCRRVCSAASRRASLLAHVVHRLTEGEGGPALRPAQNELGSCARTRYADLYLLRGGFGLLATCGQRTSPHPTGDRCCVPTARPDNASAEEVSKAGQT